MKIKIVYERHGKRYDFATFTSLQSLERWFSNEESLNESERARIIYVSRVE